MDIFSVVENFPGDSPGECGYCKNYGSRNQGVWGHRLMVDDYQDLIDRGWRRSGKYTYKPSMDLTCCPLYTIRCHAKDFQPSKGQKKVAKKVNKFIKNGKNEKSQDHAGNINEPGNESENKIRGESVQTNSHKTDVSEMKIYSGQKKAKIIRLERKMEKLKKQGKSLEKKPGPNLSHKTLDDFLPQSNVGCDVADLNTAVPQSMVVTGDSMVGKHNFELRLIKADQKDAEFKKHFNESFQVYRKYQKIIHKDEDHECDQNTFRRFLCDSPLVYETRQNVLLGAFHQHYLLDGKIIAVGVIDILPTCVSSVYLYYDPDFGHLSLGTYSALREIQLVNQLTKSLPTLAYYYMGYYVHSCPKMKYKGHYLPSDLLSPVSYTWHDITLCSPLLDENKFCSFSELPTRDGKAAIDEELDINNVLVLCMGRQMTYRDYVIKTKARDKNEVASYLSLMGQKLAQSVRLYRRHSTGGESNDSSDEYSD